MIYDNWDILQIGILYFHSQLFLTITILKPDHSGKTDGGANVARVFILSLILEIVSSVQPF